MSLRRLTMLAMLIALSFVGASIPIPTPVMTTALDSAPGFFTGIFFGPVDGAIVGAFGHLFTALMHGFPLTPLIHIIIAVEMGLTIFLFGWLWKKHQLAAGVVGVLLNGVLSPLSLTTVLSFKVATSMVIPLLLASGINIVAAVLLHSVFRERIGENA